MARRSKVERLTKRGDVQGLTKLLDAEETRTDAIDALRGLGTPDASEALVIAYSHDLETAPDARDRLQALKALAGLGLPSASEPLVGALTDEDQDVANEASRRLPEVAGPKAVEPLLRALHGERDDLRVSAAEGLATLGEGFEPLVDATAHEDPKIRQAALLGLASHGGVEALPSIMHALEDPDVEAQDAARIMLQRLVGVRQAASKWEEHRAVIRALAKQLEGDGEERAPKAVTAIVDALSAVLREEDMDLRVAAAKALGALGAEEGVDPLVTAMNDTYGYRARRIPLEVSAEYGDAKAAAALALGRIGGDTARAALVAVQGQSSPRGPYFNLNVAEAAAQALEEMDA